jgi:NAD(P)-dependent dehydrogenase (short-subunit alcohol dehydrogenase family)
MLADQVAVVTGSGRGIGRAISHALAKEGAKVVISDINEELCKQTAADFEKGRLRRHRSSLQRYRLC